MSGVAQGIYALLLFHQWQLETKSDFLKSDPGFLMRLLKVPALQPKAACGFRGYQAATGSPQKAGGRRRQGPVEVMLVALLKHCLSIA
jgi:hypothetical protein